jgi:hypothetical protein
LSKYCYRENSSHSIKKALFLLQETGPYLSVFVFQVHPVPQSGLRKQIAGSTSNSGGMIFETKKDVKKNTNGEVDHINFGRTNLNSRAISMRDYASTR